MRVLENGYFTFLLPTFILLYDIFNNVFKNDEIMFFSEHYRIHKITGRLLEHLIKNLIKNQIIGRFLRQN